MPTITTSTVTDDAGVHSVLVPRDDLVLERAADEGIFVLDHGPFERWERRVTIEPAAPGTGLRVTERIEFRLALPVWRVLFNPLVRHAATLPANRRSNRWWMPPSRLDGRTARGLGLLCVLSGLAGYLGTLLTQTNTFAKTEFASSDTEISVMLAAVRLAALLALVVVAMADRRGRRLVLWSSAVAACVITATGALAGDLVVLGASQTLARTFSTALALVIAIYAVEEMPAGSRAFSVSVLAMTAALGAGVCVMVLPLADLGVGGWRLLYVLPLAFVPIAWRIGRALPETRRFERTRHLSKPAVLAERREPPPRSPMQRRRFVLLATSALLVAVFVTPASQLLNEFLRTEHGFSAAKITAFTLLTNTPGGIGVIIGGRLADTRGRRVVGAVAIGGGTALTVAMFLATGAWIWVWSVLGAVVGAAAIPALGVYGPELFPTAARGSANGGINIAGVAGAAGGLVAAGLLSDAFGGLPWSITTLAVGPALVVVLIAAFYPETAHRELEELNPSDAGPEP